MFYSILHSLSRWLPRHAKAYEPHTRSPIRVLDDVACRDSPGPDSIALERSEGWKLENFA